MPDHLDLWDVMLRLSWAIAAGVVLGFDRSGHGRPAGLRTMLLVSVSAALAMILANRLLAGMHAEPGTGPAALVRLDFMRLPLGVLSGIGFLGAGAIIQRKNLVSGLTTAASLWSVTVIGLCFGAGEISLGIAGSIIAIVALALLDHFEMMFPRDQQGELTIRADPDFIEHQLEQELRSRHCRATGWQLVLQSDTKLVRCEVSYRGREGDETPRLLAANLATWPTVHRVEWKEIGT